MASAAAKRAGVGAIATTCSIDHATSTDTTDGVSQSARSPRSERQDPLRPCSSAYPRTRFAYQLLEVTAIDVAVGSCRSAAWIADACVRTAGVQFRMGDDPRLAGTAIAQSVVDLIGNTPLVRLKRISEVEQHPQRAGDEDGDHQPRRLVEGPAGAGDDPGRRARRPAAAGRHDRRADQRQHRRRPGHRRRPARLPVRVRDDRQGRPGEDLAAQGVRRRGRRVPGGRRPRGSAELLLGRRAARPTSSTRSAPTSTPTRTTRWPTRRPPGPSCGRRPAGASPTSSPAPARAARSPASPATSRRRTRRSRSSPPTRRARCSRGGSGRPYLVEGVGEDFFPAAWDREPLRRRHRDQRRGELPHRPPGRPRSRAS